MSLLQRLVAKLGVLPSEHQLLKWSCIHAFATGCAGATLNNVPSALFLSNFSSGALSYIYIANAAISLLLGFLYSYLLSKVRFSRLQFTILSVIALLVFLFWVSVSASDAPWIVVAFITVAWVISDFSKLEFWSVLNRLFTLQQAKRLFGFIGGASSIAGIITGFASPFLIDAFGLKQLLLISGAASCVSILAFIKLKKIAPQKIDAFTSDEGDEGGGEDKISFGSLFKNRYYVYIFATATLAILVSYSLDMLFNTLAQDRYPSPAELGSFFALFYAMADIARLVCVSLLSTLLRKFGVVLALAIQPMIVVVFGLFAFATSLVPSGVVFGFWLVSFAQLFYGSYGGGVGRASSLILYQPLFPKIRSLIQSATETAVMPIATALIGALMLLADKTVGISMMTFMPFIILANVLWFVITLFLKSGYVRALENALSKPYLTQTDIHQVEKTLLPLLQKKLESPYPEEVIFALKALEKGASEQYKDALGLAFDSKRAQVRKYAVSQVPQYGYEEWFDKTRKIALQDDTAEVRSAAMLSLAASPKAGDQDTVRIRCKDADPIVREGAILGVLKYLKKDAQVAVDGLKELIASKEREQRRRAANIIGESDDLELRHLLLSLLDDEQQSVRETAILALGKIGAVDELRAKLNSQDLTLAPHAMLQAVVVGKESVSQSLIAAFTRFPLAAQQLIMRASGYLKSELSKSFLLEYMVHENLAFRHPAISALAQRHFQAHDELRNEIDRLIDDELSSIRFFRTKIDMVPDEKATKALRNLLMRHVKLAQDRLLAILSFTHGYDEMLKIRVGLRNRDEDQKSYALELLDRILVQKHTQVLEALGSSSASAATPTKFDVLLHEILENQAHAYDSFVVVAAIYYAGEQRKGEFSAKINTYVGDKDPLLQETARWALGHLSEAGAV